MTIRTILLTFPAVLSLLLTSCATNEQASLILGGSKITRSGESTKSGEGALSEKSKKDREVKLKAEAATAKAKADAAKAAETKKKADEARELAEAKAEADAAAARAQAVSTKAAEAKKKADEARELAEAKVKAKAEAKETAEKAALTRKKEAEKAAAEAAEQKTREEALAAKEKEREAEKQAKLAEKKREEAAGEAASVPNARRGGGFFSMFSIGTSARQYKSEGHKIFVNHSILPSLEPSNAKIEISLGEQRARVYRKEGAEKVLVIDTDISSGRSGYTTPTGTYSIREKKVEKRSNLYGTGSGSNFVGADMPYWMRVTGGIGMHVGIVPGYPASHGCIRVPASVQPLIFSKVGVGTTVTIHH